MFYLFNCYLFVEIESKEGRKLRILVIKQLQQMTAYRKFQEIKYLIPEPGTTISGFADSKIKKKSMPTDPGFFWHVTINTHIFFLALQWPELK